MAHRRKLPLFLYLPLVQKLTPVRNLMTWRCTQCRRLQKLTWSTHNRHAWGRNQAAVSFWWVDYRSHIGIPSLWCWWGSVKRRGGVPRGAMHVVVQRHAVLQLGVSVRSAIVLQILLQVMSMLKKRLGMFALCVFIKHYVTLWWFTIFLSLTRIGELSFSNALVWYLY